MAFSSRFAAARITLILLIVIVSGGSAQGLTLIEAIHSAARNNEDVRIAAARVARARAVRRDAWGSLLPSATVSYSYVRRQSAITRIVNDERVVLTPRDAKNAEISVDLTLLDFANIPLVQSAHQDLQAERMDSSDVFRSLGYEVASTFFEVLAADRQAVAARRRREVAAQFVQDARDKVEAGLANRNELTRLELELASADLVSTQTENTLVKTRLLLGYLIGRELDEPLEEPAAQPLRLNEQNVAARERGRPDFQSAVFRANAARARARGTWFEWLPDLGLRFTRFATEFVDDNNNSNTDWQVAGTLTWELFQPRLFAQTGIRSSEYRVNRESAAALRRRLILDSRTAEANVTSAEAALSQAEVRQRVAEQNAEEVRERFRLGLATALEQADANVAEFEARAELARQRFALQQALLDRARADGYGPEALFTETNTP